MPARARVIYGCAGTGLSAREKAFFREIRPWGFILFARNVETPEQLRSLISTLRDTVNDTYAPVLIDQEGGRVARLKPPHWARRPAWQKFGDLYRDDPEAASEAAYLNARAIAQELTNVGINLDCVPVLDVPVQGADAVIGDRAFSGDPAVVTTLGKIVIRAMLDAGVLPIMKHIPGHGRATGDSHHALPRVSVSEDGLRKTDFVPFRALKDCPLAMTAHVVYETIDPDSCATTSPKVISEVIRDYIGFDGLLMSDDLSMKALQGTFEDRSRAALSAGCDVLLHCNGEMAEMEAIATQTSVLAGDSLRRANAALAKLRTPQPFDAVAAQARVASALGAVA